MNRMSSLRRTSVTLAIAVCIIVLLVQFGSIANQPHWSQMSTTGATREYSLLVGMMARIADPLRDAYYSASQACEAVTPNALRVHAQAALNLLEGVDSPLFDESLGTELTLPEGIRTIVDSYAFTEGWYDPETTSSRLKETLEEWLADIQFRLSTASQSAVQVLADESFDSMQVNMRGVCIMLDFALGLIGPHLREWGYEIWLSPGDSIQGVLDDAREGATIYLAPAIYTELLTINKKVTLVGTSVESGPRFTVEGGGYETVLQPKGSQPAISVFAHRPIEVVIREMTIQSASLAIQVGGEAQVTLEDVDIVESAIGVSAGDTASLTMIGGGLDDSEIAIQLDGSATASFTNCEIDDSGIAVQLRGSAYASLASMMIQDSAALEGAVQLHGESSLEMAESWIFDSGGNGILVRDDSKLSLIESHIYSSENHGIVAQDRAALSLVGSNIYMSGGDGVRLSGDCSLTMNDSSISTSQGFGIRALTEDCAPDGFATSEYFTGTVMGSGNQLPQIPVLGARNMQGPFCPADLEFLMDQESLP